MKQPRETLTPKLAPKLTPLDKRILNRLSDRGKRPARIAIELSPTLITGPEVRGILRGLEHLGLARNNRGWWTR